MAKTFQIRTYTLLFIFFIYSGCSSQNKSNVHYDEENIMKGKVFLMPLTLIDTDKQMKIFADSLNKFTNDSELPKFLFKNCFDMQPVLWHDLHHPMSLRVVIAQKTTDTTALGLVIKKLSKVEKYNKCDTDSKIPYIEKSFTLLLIDRKKELNNR